ncbi:HEAT repeat domain-containing protein [uncultured Erythrobacter sp.]|uniref:HEAT repeat domain-containing protein n=1 Tax=uncultured Erythrobacter sp. TaxID=263913 RepID=UPI002608D5A7|nr:HEAT repeat domain-containing protein [uncultured Erythrobacter sp.]
MSETDIEGLFSQTLIGDYDDGTPWQAVHDLRTIGTRQVFDRAAEWCRSSDDMRRARGADILAQVGWNEDPSVTKAYKNEALAILLSLLEVESETQTIASALHALGHIQQDAAISTVVSFAQHTNADVRYAVACALGQLSDDPVAIQTLIALMMDEDEDIRDWATFGLGTQSEADDEQIREALAARLNDENEDVRFEALIGLGRRRDRRAIGYLKTILHDEPENTQAIEAAAMLLGLEEDTPVEVHWLLGALQRLQRWGGQSVT